jgi:predicted pyridoxine 5'-phosphate oxidase superfamily flavin-nucleotide-binding protein
MKAADPAVLEVLRRSMVARIATPSRNGRPSINPLYFVQVNGQIWLGTVEWTLAARNVQADPRVRVLFEVERDPSDARVLRIRGRARVARTGRRSVRTTFVSHASTCRRPGESATRSPMSGFCGSAAGTTPRVRRRADRA